MSKALMTQLHRVAAAEQPPPRLVAAMCPGLCRTYMATGRGTLMSSNPVGRLREREGEREA